MKKVLCLGDSLTSGWGVSPKEAMPVVLEEMALNENKKIQTVNAGIPGDTSFGASQRLGKYLDGGLDVCIVWLGTNDLMQGYGAESIKNELKSICLTLKSIYPKASILICNVDYPVSFSPIQLELADRITELAAEHGLVLVKCPLYDVIGKADFIQLDGLHPNAAGTRRGAEAIWSTLRQLI